MDFSVANAGHNVFAGSGFAMQQGVSGGGGGARGLAGSSVCTVSTNGHVGRGRGMVIPAWMQQPTQQKDLKIGAGFREQQRKNF